MRSLPLRLQPGVDLRRSVEELGRLHLPDGAFVLCGIGSLTHARLRLAAERAETEFRGPFEILTLSGTVTAQGAHLHASIAGADGRVRGGHVAYGNEVRTTVELVLLGPEGWTLTREQDPATGFLELVAKPSSSAEGAA